MMETIFVLPICAIVFWACWKYIFKRILRKNKSINTIKARIAAHKIPDEAYFEMAGEEIKRGQLRQGLWLKAMALASGESQKAQAIYLKLRVETMRQEAADSIKAAMEKKHSKQAEDNSATTQKTADKAIISCPRCDGKLRVIANKNLQIKCAHCDNFFDMHT
jgi:Zn finger protein HypA/HybF involved in hydrogenase expression